MAPRLGTSGSCCLFVALAWSAALQAAGFATRVHAVARILGFTFLDLLFCSLGRVHVPTRDGAAGPHSVGGGRGCLAECGGNGDPPCEGGVCFGTASGVRLGVNGANVCRPCGDSGRPRCQSALLPVPHATRSLLAARWRAGAGLFLIR